MKKHLIAVGAACASLALAACVSGCAKITQLIQNETIVPVPAQKAEAFDPATIEVIPAAPEDHAGRFDKMGGADGCYNCHGVKEDGTAKVATATALPEDHYLKGDTSTCKTDPVRAQCYTCHIIG